ncbi:hypothetical protein QUF76_00295 [Desulfobacterales bacterium HSG16]|nr:hypothetical protein [Desulfobacterales bacterium HSG16]
MITFKDIVSLNRKKAKKRKLAGKKKSFAVLFTFLFSLIMLINASYGIGKIVREFIFDTGYPRQPMLIIRPDLDSELRQKSEYRYIDDEDIEKIEKMEGVSAIQKEIHFSSGHFFVLNRFSHIVPEFLLGYEDSFFNLYVEKNEKSELENGETDTIPILLSENMFFLKYVPEKKYFIRREKEEKAKFLGKDFNIIIDPFCRESFRWKRNSGYRNPVNPVLEIEAIKKRQAEIFKDFEYHSPGMLSYCHPLVLKFTIVGFIKDKAHFSNMPYGYGVIPSDKAKMISEIVKMRMAAKGGRRSYISNNRHGRSFLLVICPEKYQEKLESEIKKMGLKAHTGKTSNFKFFSEIKKAVKKEKSLIYIPAFILSAFSFFMMLSIYKILSLNVKDAVREIGIMRCIGATSRDISRVFRHLCFYDVFKVFFAALVLSDITLMFIGYKTSVLFNRMSYDLATGDIGVLITAVGDFSATWLIAPLWIQLLPVLILIPVTLLAAYLPSRKASKIDPVMAMKA